MDIATELRSPASQIGFLVMCAYFKVAKAFYNPRDFHAPDTISARWVMIKLLHWATRFSS
ncbi:hypothetical protein [Palleronia caenipelagi]|uniref:Uncharacterized protein n=1 Tax=Palleronia caenipelagi TaxID=2489174 RepID=A0A547PL89_9RHOB|nr:hypothetical protein [Palleronia caenipelagi]TRD14909.1 hypothetical protein FEV53_18120 [Palleronia caenipelagi]